MLQGKKQIQGDESENTVFKVLREEFSVQHGALQSSLEIAEKNLPVLLTPSCVCCAGCLSDTKCRRWA